ncbi:MAG TPA: C45 family autoproteolytic acyltransferase/hydrolase [Terrimesophilobacter sp.]|nr:C45 family autoproteolytic acyltransferase/hydrolase [Terrimesophilobacter sp.]
MPEPLDQHRFSGSHLDIGRQYGETCRDRILQHLDLALAKLDAAGISGEDACRAALAYRPFVQRHAGFLDEEIVGLAGGASITLAEAYLLQLRAEVFADFLGEPEGESECTTFAIEPSVAKDRVALAGQNADLPEIYEQLMVVVEFDPTEGSRVLMVVPAGQISYIGINDRGMAVFGNFLQCHGWVRGFPRYLLSRFALEFSSAPEAVVGLRGLPRASSRNLLMVGSDGQALDFENTPTRDHVLYASEGVLVHSNHYVAPELADAECSVDPYLRNSHIRLARISALVKEIDEPIGRDHLARIMRDRVDAPDALSVEARDLTEEFAPPEGHYMTVCSVIAESQEARMWVAPGPPSLSAYTPYTFSDRQQDLPSL